MSQTVEIRIDNRAVQARTDDTVAAALLNAGVWRFRESVSGEPRGPLCGMGICYECRVTINGASHRRACVQLVVAGMEIVTNG